MKLKNKKVLMVIAMLLMVTLVAGMGAMTYARYVTSKTMDTPETATVAEWGYVLNIDSGALFGEAYEGNAINESFTDTAEDKIDVKTKASSNLVAPGTSGSMTITLSGNAEVLAQFTIEVADTTKDVALVYKIGAEGEVQTYNPIKWTLTKKVGTAAPTTLGNANTTLDAIVTSLEAESEKFVAGTSIEETVYTLTWSWAINASLEATDLTNRLDTALGMKAAGKADNVITEATGIILATDAESNTTNTALSVSISASVTQIQD